MAVPRAGFTVQEFPILSMHYDAIHETEGLFAADARWLARVRKRKKLDLASRLALAKQDGKNHIAFDDIASGWIRRQTWTHWAFDPQGEYLQDFTKEEVRALKVLHAAFWGITFEELRKASKLRSPRLQKALEHFEELELIEYGEDEKIFKRNDAWPDKRSEEEQQAFADEIKASLKRLGVAKPRRGSKKRASKKKVGKKKASKKTVRKKY